MIEQEPKNQESIEKIFAHLREVIKPVLEGDRARLDILVVGQDPYSGKMKIIFLPDTSVPTNEGIKAFKRLRRKLGFTGSYTTEEKELLPSCTEGPNLCLKTELEGIEFVKEQLFNVFDRRRKPMRVTW